MEKQIKKTRKAKVLYTFNNSKGKSVKIDLNNFKVVCNKTGKEKQFYHKYLNDLINRKYAGNIDTFKSEYVSREAAPSSNERKKARLIERIQKLSVQLSNLKGELAEVESGVECFPDA